jgi:hypothetical protein
MIEIKNLDGIYVVNFKGRNLRVKLKNKKI